jgi:RNA polymerase sigma factor (sigma-70 family)
VVATPEAWPIYLRGSSVKQAADDPKFAMLMASAQNGDRAAYASLLQGLVPVLRRLMRRKLGFMQAIDREDLVQEVLLSLHVARATYDISRPFIPWLMSIAHNRMVDCIRRHKKIWANEVLADEFAESTSDEAPLLPEAKYRDPEALHQAVRHLPAQQRTAIELVKFRELSLKEAADLSGISMGALKVSVHRAVKNLRGALA